MHASPAVLAPEDREWLELLPKVELHLHLEGAIPLEALWTLVCKYGPGTGIASLDALRERMVYRDFAHFIETWVWKNGFIREYDDLTFAAEAVARDLARQNIRYAETFYSPADFARHGLQPERITEAIRRGLDRVTETEVALIVDLVRDYGPANASAVLEAIADCRCLGVIGIGIGGSEHRFPPEPFAPVYARARALGFRTTAHAGEAAGAGSVWGAIRALKVERIGHGTRAGEDPELVDHLAEHAIPLELCPLSNLRTGVIPSLAAHPVRRFREHGLLITINTDDPQMFGSSLVDEYAQLMQVFGFSRQEIRELIRNGARASWLPPAKKEQLERSLLAASTPLAARSQ
ncbi:MAG: adenosine deaminase [Candidatus Schekmanbacteria bacterium]|nr:adenosine deaminase [Candidatus Schekmanbacteria bacterium]